MAAADTLSCTCTPGGFPGGEYTVSVSQDSECVFTLSGGVFNAGDPYLLLASASGTFPPTPFADALVPLVGDDLFLWSLQNPNTIIPGTQGTLGPFGLMQLTWTLPAGVYTSLAGEFLHFAFVRTDVTGLVASNAVLVKLVP